MKWRDQGQTPDHAGLSQRQPDTRHYTLHGDRLSNWQIHYLSKWPHNNMLMQIHRTAWSCCCCCWCSCEPESAGRVLHCHLEHGIQCMQAYTHCIIYAWSSAVQSWPQVTLPSSTPIQFISYFLSVHWCSRLSERDYKFNSYDTYWVYGRSLSHISTSLDLSVGLRCLRRGLLRWTLLFS